MPAGKAERRVWEDGPRVVLILAIVVSALFIPWPWNLVVVLCGAIAEVGEVVWGLRLARRWRPKTGPETMVGETAEVVVPCRPSGQVRVHGELWEARCAAGADIGEDVRITALEGLTLVVEPVHAASTSPGGSRILDGSG
jgi:membrane protein implicated in regulation of membrane protease activity